VRDVLRASLGELGAPLSGLRVLLVGFSGAGFPGGDGADEAAAELSRTGLPTVRVHGRDPELHDRIAESYDLTIVCNTRVGEVLQLPARVWECGRKTIYWCWDLRPGSHGEALRGRVRHAFLSYRGEWRTPGGELYSPEQWQAALDCPIGYAPQGAPIREPTPAAEGVRALFVGDLANGTYHRGRGEICKAVGAVVMNERKRAARLRIEALLPSLYPSARYCLSMSPRAPGYTSVRTYSILACGGLLVLHRFPGAGTDPQLGFEDGENCITFDTVHDLRRRLADLDDDEAERRRIAENGRRLHATKHTVAHRVLSICHQVL
jgi:hypothetical protein